MNIDDNPTYLLNESIKVSQKPKPIMRNIAV